VNYKDYDKNLYTNAGKRTTHDDSEKILFQTLGTKYEDAQLMVAPSDVLGIYLAKIFIHQYFSSINTGVENILKPFFKNNKEMDREIILDPPTHTAMFDEVRQFLIEIAWNPTKIDTTLEKGKYDNKNLFAFEQVDGI
jgi:predicted rRNA methylase YqxC with S4 and FtsJ domains